MPSPWEWSKGARRYRNTVTGRFMSAKQMLSFRDKFVVAQKARMVAITERFTAGEFGLLHWQTEMRTLIRQSLVDQYVMARGGRGMMTPSDWGKIGKMMQGQNKFLRGFAADLHDSNLSAAQAKVRSALYAGASRAAFEKGKGQALGMPDLPQYPGDGNTVCGTNCQCAWEIVETEDGWDATWSLGAAEHCPDCIALAAQHAPLHVARGEA